jgi:hypothetical protein
MFRAESGRKAQCRKAVMRAETELLVDEIKQAVDLLRRHL